MGRKKHSLGKEFSDKSLKEFCETVGEDDGGRFASEKSIHTHKGLGQKQEYKQKYRKDYSLDFD